jgi:methylmalonyl-CoA mutase
VALYSAFLKSNNIDSSTCSGGLLIDPLEYYEKSGYLITPIEGIFNRLYNTIMLAGHYLPLFSVISINGSQYSNFGANAVQELAFIIAKTVTYIREMLNRGLNIDSIAQKITLSLSLGQNFFMEIAKLRAVRWLWAKIIKSFGGNEQSQKVKIHAFATGINKSTLDTYNNILRNTSESIEAILGGADVIHLRNFDELFGCPGDISNRITRNILNVLKEECNLTATVDPGGGSWYLETLTEELAQKSYKLFQEIESKGGYLESLKIGFPQEIVGKVLKERVSNIYTRKNTLVGVNKYPNIYEEPLKTKEINLEKIAGSRYEELNNILNNRNNLILGKKLEKLQKAFKEGSDERFKLSLDCAEAGATIGEIEFYTNFEENGKLIINDFEEKRLSKGFEELRLQALSYKDKKGSFPRVFLANIGSINQYKARVDFCLDAFLVGGFEPIIGEGYSDALTAAKAALDCESKLIVICSSDDLYPNFVPPFVEHIKKHNSSIQIILAGYPVENIEQFRSAGVDEFIHLKSNIYELMTKLHNELNILEKEGK